MTTRTQAPMTAEQQALAAQWLHLVAWCMKRCKDLVKKIGADEAKSLGRYALCQAALHFDPTRGIAFSTYATKTLWAYWHQAADRRGTVITYKSGGKARGRKQYPRPVVGALPADALLPPEFAAAATDLDFDEVELIRYWVGLLPLRWRQVVQLVYLEGWRVCDTAALLGCTPQNVRNLLGKGLAFLRKHLEWDGQALHLATWKGVA